jgi:flagellum-specific peptidoglycan hydrolase FlgJ
MPSAAKATTSAAGAGVTAAALSTNDSDDQPKSQAATPPNPPTTAGGSGTSILDPSYTKVNPPAKVASLPPAKDSTRATEPASGVKSFSKYEPPKSNKEFYDRMTKAGVSAGMSEPQAKQMASLSALESNWGKSSMTNRANNPFGQTITQKQIGSNGIVGSTVGADGQLHAVYDSPESAVSHHVSHYTDDPATTYSNMAKGGYNTNPAWGPTIHGVHKSMNPDQPSKIDENTTGSVGGLGFNTGNPAADANALQQYIDTNGALAKDDENGNLIKMHNALHAPLGFKEFDPKKDLAKGKK